MIALLSIEFQRTHLTELQAIVDRNFSLAVHFADSFVEVVSGPCFECFVPSQKVIGCGQNVMRSGSGAHVPTCSSVCVDQLSDLPCTLHVV